jgi:hypothetical protein
MYKPTRIEFSLVPEGKCDVELLDQVLSDMAWGSVERLSRLFNIKRWEHAQLKVVLKGNVRVWQPFRPQFSTNQSGHYTVVCADRFRSHYALECLTQLGFTVVNVEAGDGPDQEIQPGTDITYACTLNGRSAKVHIVRASQTTVADAKS